MARREWVGLLGALVIGCGGTLGGPSVDGPGLYGGGDQDQGQDQGQQEPICPDDGRVLLQPSYDVKWDDVIGVPQEGDLFLNVRDGTSFAFANDLASYVRTRSGAEKAHHKMGVEPVGDCPIARRVDRVTVHYRAQAMRNARGNIRIELWQGERKLGRGDAQNLGRGSLANYSEAFDDLHLTSLDDLVVKVIFRNEKERGYLLYTQLWAEASPD
jgi:hypothetical protein